MQREMINFMQIYSKAFVSHKVINVSRNSKDIKLCFEQYTMNRGSHGQKAMCENEK